MRIIKCCILTLTIICLVLLQTSCNQQDDKISKQDREKQVVKPKPLMPEVQPEVIKQPDSIVYRKVAVKKWMETADFADTARLRIVLAVNRIDYQHFKRMDSVIVPDEPWAGIEKYLPFPERVTYLDSISKIIFFSYPAQSFAAYEKGNLVYTGPVSMGRKKYPTPIGLYFTNWKSKKSISSVNDEWVLPWNFNIANRMGIGWHQYALPGYPASHSCLRLQAEDARYLYYWADQWVLDNDTIVLKGTPVIVFGEYDFDGRKPWWQLTDNPKALNISADDVKDLVEPHFNEIILWQYKRQNQPGLD